MLLSANINVIEGIGFVIFWAGNKKLY
jgi:hypothetical protein